MSEIKLTQYSKSSGCGCKIAPEILNQILKQTRSANTLTNLLVGNKNNDDAAVIDLGNEQALISTVDFFTPMVNDAELFGKIAAANAISDVYAMGGKPILAVAILGWPIDKLSSQMAAEVLKGALQICAEAGIEMAGGHSIESAEPFFGLSVNGLVNTKQIKRNCTAKPGDILYLTKPLGSGILSAALKRDKLESIYEKQLFDALSKLNKIGEHMAELSYINAITDITGFGFLGHLLEMMEGSSLSAEIDYRAIQMLDGAKYYSSQLIVPDNLYRNWNNCKDKVLGIGQESFLILNDPQTNGGLLVAVNPEKSKEFETFLINHEYEKFITPIGKAITGLPTKIDVLNAV